MRHTSRSQRIVDDIVGSERYTRVFSDRVYGDEPILRTGSEAFKDVMRPQEKPDASASVRRAVTPHAKTSLSPMYKKMRNLARSNSSWGYRYGSGGSRLFYEQGMLMADFEEHFDGDPHDLVIYYPTYDQMSDYELRCYFSWRTRLRAGETPSAPLSFLFVHAYELLCGIGVEAGECGYAELDRFATQYAGASDAFDAHLRRWRHDYVVLHGLDNALLGAGRDDAYLRSVAVLRQAEEALLARGGGGGWPDHGCEGLPAAEELFDALCTLSRYRADRSKFFRENREDCALVSARVFARMVAHCHKRRKTDYVDGLFGEPTRWSYTMFPSAIYWSPDSHPDATYVAGDYDVYVCERGFWWREVPCRHLDTNKELGALMHAVDCRMRLATGDPHPLKERKLPKYQGKFVDEEIGRLMDQRRAEEAARVRIDRSALAHIRSAAARTREALLTDEEREEEAMQAPAHVVQSATSRVVGPSAPLVPHAVPQSPAAAAGAASTLGLDERQLGVLRALLAQEPLPGDALLVSLAIDAINEAFLDVVGDTVVEFDGDTPVLVEDYLDDVRSYA